MSNLNDTMKKLGIIENKNNDFNINDFMKNLETIENENDLKVVSSNDINNFMKTMHNEADAVNNFNPYRREDQFEPFTKGIPLIFITTPFLNFCDQNVNANSFFSYLSLSEPDILKSLSYGNGGNKTSSPFIKILSNRFDGISTKDTLARTKELNETFYGNKQMLPGSNIDSVTGDELSIKYTDTKYLHITKLNKAWTDYVELIRRGEIAPSDDVRNHRYIDFTSTLYYFLLDFDMQTILFYSQYVGLVPISNPYSNFGMELTSKDISPIDISYIYSYKQDLDPHILMDFNLVSNFSNNLVNYDKKISTDKVIEIQSMPMKYDNYYSLPDFTSVKIVKRPTTSYSTNNIENNGKNRRFTYKLLFYTNQTENSILTNPDEDEGTYGKGQGDIATG